MYISERCTLQDVHSSVLVLLTIIFPCDCAYLQQDNGIGGKVILLIVNLELWQ